MPDSISPKDLQERFGPLLAECPGGSAAVLAGALTRRDVSPDHAILSTDVDSNELLLIWEGRFGVWIGDEERERVGTVGPGAWLGDVTFIEPGRPSADVIAETPSVVLALSNVQLKTLVEVSPPLARGLLHAVNDDLIRRLRAVDRELRGGAESQAPDGWLKRLWAGLHRAQSAPGGER